MNYLFMHNSFSAQFKHIVTKLASDSTNKVVFLSNQKGTEKIANVKHIVVKIDVRIKTKFPSANSYMKRFLFAEFFGKAMSDLKRSGFYPDIIYSHIGWGCTTYATDIFPHAVHAGFFEWYYNKEPRLKFAIKYFENNDTVMAINHQRNMCILDALANCDICISPTEWQKIQHPKEFHDKIHVIHDGVDTNYFSPAHKQRLALRNCDLAGCEEIVTYATRGLEPYRGFPFFYRSLERVLEKRPHCHALIMANDATFYGDARPDKKTWKQYMMETVSLDMKRVHFLPYSSYATYRNLLLNSSTHVYLTVPFVLSWSMIEAMACGCQIVSSDIEPVREALAGDGASSGEATLVNMENTSSLADAIIDGLERTEKHDDSMRRKARQTAVKKYSLEKLLPMQLKILHSIRPEKQIYHPVCGTR